MHTLLEFRTTTGEILTLEDDGDELQICHRFDEDDPCVAVIPIAVEALERMVLAARELGAIRAQGQRVLQFGRMQ